MLKKILITLSTAGALVVSAAGLTYKVSLLDDSTIGGKQFKAGDYKVELKDNDTALVTKGKKSVEVAVKTETAPSKFSTTEIEYVNDHQVQEIRIGGTTTRLVFSGANTASNGME
ncbi:MAG TPA: hypothetical protein VH302_02665 [Bryobacteraceae bacterium]|jgi:hypothetical protein|nr:hypothetical protein [Bryobacteraceae bacterium]